MKKTAAGILMGLFWFGCCMASEPVPVILDTDIGIDVDDVLALGMLHALQSRGQCELLAVTISKNHPQSAALADAINTFYGRPDIPIGVIRNGPLQTESSYNRLVEERNADGSLRYPHDLMNGDEAPEASGLLRQILSDREDQSVVLIQVGPFANFRRLLESVPDENSPLSGKELIRRKVRFLSVMGGSFSPEKMAAHFIEWNVKMDIPSAQKLAAEWPTPVIWSGVEIGRAVLYPAVSIERDYEYVPFHPLKEAYYLFRPPPHCRPTWDLTSVLYAVQPDCDYFALSKPVRITIEDDGFSRFVPDEKSKQCYLILDESCVARLREAFVQLCSQPPEDHDSLNCITKQRNQKQ